MNDASGLPATLRFERFAGAIGIVVGLGGLAYAALFVWIVADAPDGVLEVWYGLLTGGALLSIVPLVGLCERLREVEPGLALAGLLFGVVAAVGGAVHGGYLLYLEVNPEVGAAIKPTPGDPSGILRYATAGLSLAAMAWLVHAGRSLPRSLALLGYLGAVLLLVTYLGRLYEFVTPTERISLLPPVLYGLVVFPTWWIWVGVSLRRTPPATAVSTRGA